MQQKQTVDVAPLEEDLTQHKENEQAWNDAFIRLAKFAKTLPNDGSPFGMKVIYDKAKLRQMDKDLDKEDSSVFVIFCGSKTSGMEDMGFYFHNTDCRIETYYAENRSHAFSRLVEKLLCIEDISKIKRINERQDSLVLNGSAGLDIVSSNDGLLIIKHWIGLIISDMKKAKPEHDPMSLVAK